MRDFTFECSIDGQHYSLGLLAMVRYQRDIHALHELKKAGAPIVLGGKLLSHDDINLLDADDAFAVSVAVRQSYDLHGIRNSAGCSYRYRNDGGEI